MTDNHKLSWNDRFALIDHFKPEDAQVRAAFKVTQDELTTARSLRDAGTFSANKNLDVAKYETTFSAVAMAEASVSTATKTADYVMSVKPIRLPTEQKMTIASKAIAKPSKPVAATSYAKPETATKKVKEPQKRGRKGDKIATALAAVPTTQMSAEEFSKQHSVSIAVLRQSKRFLEQLPAEQRAAIGKINVRQDKDSRVLMIWREPLTS